MDAILHILGTCSDTHAHFDLLDVFFLSASAATPMALLIKLKIKVWLDKWKKKKVV